MSIDKLKKIVPPPTQPSGPADFAAAWRGGEEALGTKLPADFRALCEAYGSGNFSGLHLFNPSSPASVKAVGKVGGWIKASGGGEYAVFPQKPGLLPVLMDDVPRYVCYLTEGKPDNWPVVVCDAGVGVGLDYTRYDLPLTALLASLFRGEGPTPWSEDGNWRFEATAYQAVAQPDPPPPESILELYEKNGRKADFWVQSEGMSSTGSYYHIRLATMPAAGKTPKFIVDIYEGGEAGERNMKFNKRDVEEADYYRVEPPPWVEAARKS